MFHPKQSRHWHKYRALQIDNSHKILKISSKVNVYMSAEDYFRDAWDTFYMDRDFSDSPQAREFYGEEEPENIEYFQYPETFDSQENPYVTQDVPLQLWLDLDSARLSRGVL